MTAFFIPAVGSGERNLEVAYLDMRRQMEVDMGRPPSARRILGALALAYFIGYLASMIPMPAALGVLDTGLAGALVLYGFSPAASVGAVLVYHAIAIWVPGLGGLVAWLPTRGRGLSKAAGVPLPEPAAQPVTLSG